MRNVGKERAQMQALVLKLCRLFKGVTFCARKEASLDWYEVICSDWELYIEDEIFEDIRKATHALSYKVIFTFSEKPAIHKGEFYFCRMQSKNG